MSTWVNVYEIDRRYGGPEEGGWWYDTGHPVESRLVHPGEDVDTIRDELRGRYPRTDRRESVLGGEDYDVIIEDHFAEAWPTERPHYE